MKRSAVFLPIITMVVGVIALTGCVAVRAPHSAPLATPIAASPTAGPTSSVAPTPGATVTPLPADALFRVTATATEPDGAIADLTETVYAPAPLSSAESAKLTTDCPSEGWPHNYPNPTGIRATVTATLHPGSKPWTSYSPVGIGPNLGNLSVWSGQFSTPFDCTAPQGMKVPSTATGVAPASPASSPAGLDGGVGWFNGLYGFEQTFDGDDQTGVPSSLEVKLSNCALQLGPLALAGNPDTAGWPTESQLQPGSVCSFGAEG